MSSVLVWLFWIWLGVSIVVLVRRRVVGRGEAGAAPDAEATDDPVAAAADDPIAAFLANSAAATAGEPPVPTGATSESTPAPQVAPEPEPVAVAAAVGPPPGLEEPALAPVERKAPRSAPAAGIADALVGIRMPCDLVPLVVDRLSSRRVTLSTTGYPAEVVGTALADEVERLGYVLRPLSDRDLVATRGATELRLSITPPGADGRHLDHPNARDDAVVVEIALG